MIKEFHINKQRRVNQSKLERCFDGGVMMDEILCASVGNHCPVPVAGMPVWVQDGSLIHMRNGAEHAEALMREIRNPATLRSKVARTMRPVPVPRLEDELPGSVLDMPFTSLSDLIAEGSSGKSYLFNFIKACTTATTAGRTSSAWNVGTVPAAGGVATAAPGGAAPVDSSTGAFPFPNPTSGDTQHITTIVAQADRASQVLILYDRTFHASWDQNGTDPRSVTGVPTRYTTAALAAGSFISSEVTTQLAAATPTHIVTYNDENGGSSVTVTETQVSASVVQTFPLATVGQYFYRLAAGDMGVTAITQLDISALGVGVQNWFIGHPLAYIPIPSANTPVILDGINSAFNLQRVFDDACLSFLDIQFAVGTTNIFLAMQTVSG